MKTEKGKKQNEIELLTEISKKLDKIIAATITQGQDIESKIKILKRFGFSSSEIGNFAGVSPSTIRMKKLRAKTKKAKKRGD